MSCLPSAAQGSPNVHFLLRKTNQRKNWGGGWERPSTDYAMEALGVGSLPRFIDE